MEYNTWLLFRQLVDVILLKYVKHDLCVAVMLMLMVVYSDFLAYCMFAFSCFRVPEGLSFTVHVMRWVLVSDTLISPLTPWCVAGLAVWR